MTRVETRVTSSAGWTLTSDTDDPTDVAAYSGRALLAPLVAEWKIAEVLPPVAVPSTVALSIYDDGSNPSGFLPIDIGDSLAVWVTLDTLYDVVTFQGKVSDVAATTARRGGMVFSVVAADRLADLGNAPAPAYITSGSFLAEYDELEADAGIDFDPHEGETFATPLLGPFTKIPTESMSVLDILNRLVSLDVRIDGGAFPTQPYGLSDTGDPDDAAQWRAQYLRPRYLAIKVDRADPTPQTPKYRLVELPRQIDEDDDPIAGVLKFDYTAGARPWVLIANDTYYDGSRTGIVLDAGNVAADIGDWRKTIRSAINTAEVTNVDADEPDPVTIRVAHADLVAQYGRVVRTIDEYSQVEGNERDLAFVLLGRREEVAAGYGFDGFTIAWETLSTEAKDAWGQALWPIYQSPRQVVYGRPIGIANVPADWLLSDKPVAGGRLIGAGFTLSGKTARVALSMTGTPPVFHTGMTYADVDTLETATGHNLTYATIDTSVTIADFGLADV